HAFDCARSVRVPCQARGKRRSMDSQQAQRRPPALSVVVATHNRLPLLVRLLEQLGRQTLPPEEFEVVVVDDGSQTPAAPALQEMPLPYECRVLRQVQAGPAAARHRGILEARGALLVV